MRKLVIVAAVLVAVVAMMALVAGHAQVAAPKPGLAPKIGVAQSAQAALLSPASIQGKFAAAVAAQSWAQAKKAEVLGAFAKLPASMQQAIVASRDGEVARRLGVASMAFSRERLTHRPVEIRLPHISDVWPASGDGSPGVWMLVYAIGVNPNCQVWFNGSARTTYYMPWGEDWGECVGCEIPAVPIARDYDLYLKDTAADRAGSHLSYRVVAPRHWRGLHGWRFANFSETTIPWDVFRHYFGANEVEDGAGHHLPAAQAWYDSRYKGVGSGGNCFGMTMRAIRTLFWQPWSLYESWWNANHLARAWDYDFVNETRRSVNEDQGAQLEASVMANKLWLLDNQNHNQAWERCRDLIGQLASNNQPALSIYGSGWGHCVWPYRTEEVGNERRIYIYDNNVPYAEDEASDATMVVRINKTTGNLTWGTATRTICRSYRDCTPADPHLPTEATEGEAAMMVTLVLDQPAHVTQITDEAGRTFYVGGRINTDPRARIPMSLLFVPERATTRDPVLPLAARRGPQFESTEDESGAPDPPETYLFGRARGKRLNVQADNMRGRSMRAFAPSLVFEVFSSTGDRADLTLNKLLTNQASLLANQLQGGEIRTIMRTGPRSQRVIGVKLLDAARGMLVAPRADRSGVTVENRSGAPMRYELEIQSFAAGKLIGVKLPTQTLAAHTGAVLAPSDWSQLRMVRMQLRNLRTGATIRRETLQGQ